MPSINLTAQRLAQLDPTDMLGKTLELAEQLQAGAALADQFLAQNSLSAEPLLDWCGLGGSAVAGDLLQAFGLEPPGLDARIFVRRWECVSALPRLVCSYSGNTVESVYALKEVPTPQVWLAVSSAGEIEQYASAQNIPHLKLPGGYPPRAAVGFSLGAVHRLFKKVYGFHDPSLDNWPLAELRADAVVYGGLNPAANPALALAMKLVDRTPVIYTCDGMVDPALAFRFRAQLAENSKVWTRASELPELMHNEVESFAHMSQVLPPVFVLFIGKWAKRNAIADPRMALEQLLASLGVQSMRIDPSVLFPTTRGRLAQGVRMMLFLDAVTIFLAVLRAEDPMEIPKITALKNLLSGS